MFFQIKFKIDSSKCVVEVDIKFDYLVYLSTQRKIFSDSNNLFFAFSFKNNLVQVKEKKKHER